MQTSNDIHLQFAEFFRSERLKPYAYLVSKKLSEGHICLHLKDVQEELNDITFFNKEQLYENATDLLQELQVSLKDGDKQPFILDNGRLYLQRYFAYETIILSRIHAFLQKEQAVYATRLQQLEIYKDFIKKLFMAPAPEHCTPDEIIDWQLVAAISAVLNNFTIITGGPGTGKTTTVAKILTILFRLEPQLKVALAAPTGKAAARMVESLKGAQLPIEEALLARFRAFEPSTIHRLLKSIPDTPYFRHNRENPLPYDVVIIDESSMIDVALFAKLLDAIGPQTRLLMLGDKDQLASVEAGSLFGDLCQAQDDLNQYSKERAQLINSYIPDPQRRITFNQIKSNQEHPLFQHVVELRYSHRFSGNKGIGRFSKAVIHNETAFIKSFFAPNVDPQVTVDHQYSQILFESFISGYEAYIKEKDVKLALKKLNNLRVLCAIREGEQGLYAINRKIEDFLQRRSFITRSGEFYEHRPVIVTRNYYHLGLFNGDTGIVRYDSKGVLRAWFEDSNGQLMSVLPGYLSDSETVYAMTIHKSQGSEFNKVLLVLPATTNITLLTRELLYTGVTRARQEVIVQGTEEVILKSAEDCVQRGSGIIGRFREL